jgi:hypothetical protein
MTSTDTTSRTGTASAVIERVKVREVAGVFRAQDALDATVRALLAAGFDRSDIDVMGSIDAIRKRLGGAYVAIEMLPEIPSAPRRAFIAREEVASPLALAAGLLAYIGATAALLGVPAAALRSRRSPRRRAASAAAASAL